MVPADAHTLCSTPEEICRQFFSPAARVPDYISNYRPAPWGQRPFSHAGNRDLRCNPRLPDKGISRLQIPSHFGTALICDVAPTFRSANAGLMASSMRKSGQNRQTQMQKIQPLFPLPWGEGRGGLGWGVVSEGCRSGKCGLPERSNSRGHPGRAGGSPK